VSPLPPTTSSQYAFLEKKKFAHQAMAGTEMPFGFIVNDFKLLCMGCARIFCGPFKSSDY